jgi:hypothetical protein
MISYAITVNNELNEFKFLIDIIKKYIKDTDEVVVIQDFKAQDDSKMFVKNILHDAFYNFYYDCFNFKNDFSKLKNYLISKCSKEYIFQLDADEYPTNALMQNIHNILKINNKFDMF